MSKKHEIEKGKLQEILEVRKQTKDKREDKRLHALELRASDTYAYPVLNC